MPFAVPPPQVPRGQDKISQPVKSRQHRTRKERAWTRQSGLLSLKV